MMGTFETGLMATETAKRPPKKRWKGMRIPDDVMFIDQYKQATRLYVIVLIVSCLMGVLIAFFWSVAGRLEMMLTSLILGYFMGCGFFWMWLLAQRSFGNILVKKDCEFWNKDDGLIVGVRLEISDDGATTDE